VAAPSHELAVVCGMEVGAAAARKMAPKLTEDQAHKVAEMAKDKMALAFELPRLQVVFEQWVQSQPSMTDDQRRDAIRGYIRHLFRSRWLPVPDDKHINW
jgi:hypothetical protein